MKAIDFYNSKQDLASLKPREIQSLLEYHKLEEDASENDLLWLLAIKILSKRTTVHMPQIDLDDFPEELAVTICEEADIPALQRFVATSRRYKRICGEILERKITPIKVVTEWYNKYAPRPLAWQEIYNLDKIDLSQKNVASVPPELGQLPKLRQLYLSDNKLTSVPPELGNLKKLESLDLGRKALFRRAVWNRLTSIPKEFKRLDKLRILRLDGNQLSSVPDLPKNLKSLDISLNELRTPPDLSGLPNLERLLLNGNLLTTPPDLTNLSNLVELNLAGNQLTVSPGMSTLTKLKQLNLSRNNLTSVTDLDKLLSLELLWLADNRLSSLPGITKLKNLLEIDLDENQFTTVPQGLNLLPKIEIVGLGDNPLTSVPAQWSPSLVNIRLTGTGLTDIPDQLQALLID